MQNRLHHDGPAVFIRGPSGIVKVLWDKRIAANGFLPQQPHTLSVYSENKHRESRSALEYNTITQEEDRPRHKALDDWFSAQAKHDPVRFARGRIELLKILGDPIPADLEAAAQGETKPPLPMPDLAAIPLKPFDDPLQEAYHRIGWLDLNSGSSMLGIETVALLLDQIHEKGANAGAIRQIRRDFNYEHRRLLREYLARLNPIKHWRELARLAQEEPSDPEVQSLQARVLNSRELDARAFELADETYWAPGAMKHSTRLLRAARNPDSLWLTYRVGHIFYAVCLESLKQGELRVLSLNLQRKKERVYLFRANSKDRVTRWPNEDLYAGYLAAELFLRNVEFEPHE
ncbi:MAG: hypothetical protein HY921_06520 [Elusimicrobia bacterium]|nr:hypothetical protein [Elusimicrobiota bacterium]